MCNIRTGGLAIYPSFIELPFIIEHSPPDYVDNSDQYPGSLVRYFLENYTAKGQRVFDPFFGFGTTALVAEDMGRVPFGVEVNGDRFQWGAGQLENWMNIIHGDSGDIAAYGFPKMDFCITSPPYMPRHHKWNPLYGGNPDYAGYDVYLDRMEDIFRQVAGLMKRNAHVVVQADNLAGNGKERPFTPLVHDFYSRIAKHLRPQTEMIVRWAGKKSQHAEDYQHTHCLIFRK